MVLAVTGIDHFLHGVTAISVLLAIIGFLCISYELLDRPRGPIRWLIQVVLPGLALASLCLLVAFWIPDTTFFGPFSIREIVTDIAVYGALIGTFNGLFASTNETIVSEELSALDYWLLQLSKESESIKNVSGFWGKLFVFWNKFPVPIRDGLRDGFMGFLFASFYFLVITYLVFGYKYYNPNAWWSDYLSFALVGIVGSIVWQSMHQYPYKSTFSQPPGTKLTIRPRIFSFRDVLAGLTFWAAVCIVLYVTAALVFAGWHLAMKVSDSVLLGTVGIVLLGGFLSGFARFQLLSKKILLALVSWIEILSVFGIAILLLFFFPHLNPLIAFLVGTMISIVGGGVFKIIFWLTKSHSAHKTSVGLHAQGDYLAGLLFWPVVWFGLGIIVVIIFLQAQHYYYYVGYYLPWSFVLGGPFLVGLVGGSLVVILSRLIFCWPKIPQLIASSKKSRPELLQRSTFGNWIWQAIHSNNGRPPIFSPRDSRLGLVFWLMAWFLSATIAQFVFFYIADLRYDWSVSDPWYLIDSSFFLSRFGVILAIALTAPLIGGLSKYIFWKVMNLPGKGLGVLGVLLTIVGFFAQLVEPSVLLVASKPTHGHSAEVVTLKWSPDGTRIASGSFDNTVQIWDVPSGNTLLTHKGNTDAVYVLAWSPNGMFIATGSLDKTVQVWDDKTEQLIDQSNWGGTIPVFGVAWSPDGKRIAYTGENNVWVWGLHGGQHIPLYPNTTSIACDLAWSPNGKRIAAANSDGTVSVWDADSQNPPIFTYQGHTGAVQAVAWSPDSKYIASAGSDNTVTECDAQSTQQKGTASDRDNTVQIWDATTGKKVFTYKHSAEVTDVAWSGIQHLASSSKDGTVKVWDPVKKSLLLTYRGHFGGVNAVDWFPDGTYIASGGDDKTVQIWDATTGIHLYTYSSSESS